MCEFVIGQQVVCINDDPLAFSHIYKPEYIEILQQLFGKEVLPIKRGMIYTISKINLIDVPYILLPHYTLEFEEIAPRKSSIAKDGGYHSERFRPLKKTNIEVFRKMLNPTEKDVFKFEMEELFEYEDG